MIDFCIYGNVSQNQIKIVDTAHVLVLVLDVTTQVHFVWITVLNSNCRSRRYYFFLWAAGLLMWSWRVWRLCFLSLSLLWSSSSFCSSSAEPSISKFPSPSEFFNSEQNATRSRWSSCTFRPREVNGFTQYISRNTNTCNLEHLPNLEDDIL